MNVNTVAIEKQNAIPLQNLAPPVQVVAVAAVEVPHGAAAHLVAAAQAEAGKWVPLIFFYLKQRFKLN